MYESFYGMREKPFSLVPDPSFLYLGEPHSKAYAVLEYGVLNQAGFTVVTGEVGSGKTTLIRHLLNRIEGRITIGLITNTANLDGNLLRWVLLAFNQSYASQDSVELHAAFEDFLIQEYAQGGRAVLLVDEAQNLSVRTLEELRMLSNINADKDLLLQIVLVGQPELKEKLERPALQQFAQRIAASYHLGALSKEETSSYIDHRLAHAGASPQIFTAAACTVVYANSDGIPRLINNLCDTALVYGYAEGALEIDERIVSEVVKDFASGVQRGRARGRSGSEPPNDDSTVPKEGSNAFDREMARELFSVLRSR